MPKLYYSGNLNPRVAVAVARQLAVPVDFVATDPFAPEVMPAYRQMNPNGLVPLLEEDGHYLWETDAIACRLSQLAGSDFWCTDPAEQVEMIRWISWGTHHFTRHADAHYFNRVVLPRFSDAVPDEDMLAEEMERFRRFAAILDAALTDKRWLVAERLTYADFRVASALPFAGPARLPLADYPEIARWHDQLMALDAWRDPFAGLA